MYVLTSQQIRHLDSTSIKRDGIPSLTLMENAGRAAFRILWKQWPHPKGKPVFIFCGPGNNGGDGLVVARHLLKKKVKVFIFIIGSPDQLHGDALLQLQKIKNHQQIYFISKLKDLLRFASSAPSPFLMVDALFGTGLTRPIKGLHQEIIQWMNAQKAPRVSLDIPSGLDADTGKVLGLAVQADATVTFGFPKLGFFFGEAPAHLGRLYVADIGLSKKAIAELHPETHLITRNDIAPCLLPRKKGSHKKSFGHVFVIGGSLGMTGAPLMTGLASLKAGAGLCTVCIPESAHPFMDPNALELMLEPVELNGDRLLSRVAGASVVVLGPGLGTSQEAISFVREWIHAYSGPLILDADALNAVAFHLEEFKQRQTTKGQPHGAAPTLLTPHPGEMARLIGKTTRYVQEHRLEVARNFAKEYGVYLLLKGYRSLLATPNGEVWINPTGNPGMASAGQGDVLAGIYAGLLSEFPREKYGLAPMLFGCFLHGLVGDLLAQKGHRVVLATDIAKNLSLGYASLKRKSEELMREFY